MKNGSPGVCIPIKSCEPVLEALKAGNKPENTCGFAGLEPIVCCPVRIRPPGDYPAGFAPPVVPEVEELEGDGRGAVSKQSNTLIYSNFRIFVLKRSKSWTMVLRFQNVRSTPSLSMLQFVLLSWWQTSKYQSMSRLLPVKWEPARWSSRTWLPSVMSGKTILLAGNAVEPWYRKALFSPLRSVSIQERRKYFW